MNLQTVLLCGLAVTVPVYGHKQSVSVKGKLTCPSEPHKARNVRVKLMDDDWGPLVDDLMAEGRTADDGTFQLSGEAGDVWGDIGPYLKIYHECRKGAEPCGLYLDIPTSSIDSKDTYDLGEVNLDACAPKKSYHQF